MILISEACELYDAFSADKLTLESSSNGNNVYDVLDHPTNSDTQWNASPSDVADKKVELIVQLTNPNEELMGLTLNVSESVMRVKIKVIVEEDPEVPKYLPNAVIHSKQSSLTYAHVKLNLSLCLCVVNPQTFFNMLPV